MSIGKIYSLLGNSNSLATLALKDVTNSVGLTAGSYITGDVVEGKDRFIDEFGTEAIWLLGIPFFKKILDFTLYKPFKLDKNIDVRIFKNPQILKKAKEFAPNDIIKSSLEKAASKQTLYKSLAFSKFALSTVLTTASYFALTKFRHKYTEKQITKDFYEKQKANYNFNKNMSFSQSFNGVHKQPSFTGKGLQDFMFNPLKNLMLVDAAITGERFTNARNKQDFIGYLVKEGGFWAFVYFAGDKIKSSLEKHSEKKHNKSIDLDARVIESDDLKNVLKNKSLSKHLDEFPIKGSDAEIYEFVLKNKDNFVVKMAKMSDIIPTLKGADSVDTRKFVDIEQVKSTATKLQKLLKEYNSSNEEIEKFIDMTRKLKRKSIRINIGSCIGVLGVVVPAIMVALRFSNKDNKEFQTKVEIENKLTQKESH